jgi:hypothetical protein
VSDSPQGTLALARTAAGAVRSLNHATLGGDGLAQPADACEVRGSAAAPARDLGNAQQQPAPVNGGPSQEEEP